MAKPSPIELQVIRSLPLSPHMQRITLGGEALAAFPSEQESAYIKLIFPAGENIRPLMRTYTIRHQRQTEIDVDFVLHADGGPASHWAATAQPGDTLRIAGPGPKKLINHNADWFLLAGDMSALPAIAVNLGELPVSARGYAVIEVLSEEDIQTLPCPENIQLQWLVNPHPDPDGAFLAEEIEKLPWLAGQPAAWVATEFGSMRTLRRLLKQDKAMAKSHLYLSSYWKLGQSEDEHKQTKRKDAELQAA